MKNRNAIAIDYLFLRSPALHALIFVPMAVGVITFLLASKAISVVEGDLFENVNIMFQSMITTYLTFAKLSLVLLNSFFLAYRWSIMEKNRNYGYWLTQGIDRNNFFIQSFFIFVFTNFLGIASGFIIVMIASGFTLGVWNIILFLIIIFIGVFSALGVAALLGELINNPELALMVYLIFYIIAYFFSRDVPIVGSIIFPELFYFVGNLVTLISHGLFFGIVLFVVAYRAHLVKDIEL